MSEPHIENPDAFQRRSSQMNRMAGTEGFEPPNAGTKTRCLTTWPRPNILSSRLRSNIIPEYRQNCYNSC